MVKLLLHRIPFIIKAALFFILLLSIFLGLSFFFIQSLHALLATDYGIDLSIGVLLRHFPLGYYAVFGGAFLLIWGLFALDVRIFYHDIKRLLLDSLSERKLPEDFPIFDSGNSFHHTEAQLSSLLSLYKSFDNMKSTRIMLEVNSIKQLMNVVDEGVLLVNSDRVVTHINHPGEHLLRLIPGEIIGEAISRKIINEIFLNKLDEALDFDQKVIAKDIVFRDNNVLVVSIFPIKDKFGDVVRSLIVVRKCSESLKDADPPIHSGESESTSKDDKKSDTDRPKTKTVKST